METKVRNQETGAIRWRPAYSLNEAAEIARISLRGIHRLISDGKLRTTQVGGRRIVPGSALRELVEGEAVE